MIRSLQLPTRTKLAPASAFGMLTPAGGDDAPAGVPVVVMFGDSTTDRGIPNQVVKQLGDVHAIFEDGFKGGAELLERVISSDGAHLTAEGNTRAAEKNAPLLHKLLAGKQATTTKSASDQDADKK